ncbi:uncharacterized protein MONBRDRAFT_27414 [Monosiga brevicollis MX1]|uniref:Heparan-sulfate 6-O-sulfotransferase n=1 Tax=Monosiga brevicollis TaxID=81824 RepID=A9V577_MONBE|nr:uncharacterized protein MONBRDRAFT_27414 [Monosiga brevicollis MX1]EDQ87227.1 predicted protein [Monosiga brevicollis MX1]|eukprot:XP_001747840.1 hypothetical protein [Monosiga brevicollis MX1]
MKYRRRPLGAFGLIFSCLALGLPMLVHGGLSVQHCQLYLETDYLFYNRIPKAGSTTLKTLGKKLGRQYHFDFNSSRIYCCRERVQAVMGPKQANWTINECMDAGDECNYLRELMDASSFNLMTTFFCGHGPECTMQTPQQALARAKQRLERDYAHVAVLERMPESLALFELLMPQFFRNARSFLSEHREYQQLNHNQAVEADRRRPTSATRAAIARLARYDMELYGFAVSLLTERLLSCSHLMRGLTIPAPSST